MDNPAKHFSTSTPKKILVTGAGSSEVAAAGKQFVVTQSKGTTIIQPAIVHGAGASSQQQYIVTG